MTPDELHAELRRRTKNPHVIERIMRLNPKGLPPGCFARGWRVGDRRRRNLTVTARFTRGQVIRAHGREAWERIPSEFIQRDGRRQYVGAIRLYRLQPELEA